MATKRTIVFIVFALFSLSLAACELSASTPPPTAPADEGSMGTLEAVLGGIATQTAAAGGVAATPAQETPEAPAETPPAGEAPPEEAEEPEPAEPPEEAEPEPEPAAATQVIAPTPTPGIPASYTLQKGEFPFCIARRFNVNQYELLNLNGLSLNSRPQVGFNLRIPQTGNTFAGDRSLQDHPTTYTVAAGDTIYSVACKFGDVDPMSIAAVNGLSAPYDLTAGDRIQIPEY